MKDEYKNKHYTLKLDVLYISCSRTLTPEDWIQSYVEFVVGEVERRNIFARFHHWSLFIN